MIASNVAVALPKPGAGVGARTGSAGGDLGTGQVLAAIGDALDRLSEDRSGLAAGQRLELVTQARHVSDRVQALLYALVDEAEKANAAQHAAGTPGTSWLASTSTASRKEASGLVFRSRAAARRKGVLDAALDGRISTAQATAIGKVFEQLPATLSVAQQDDAEGVLLKMAARMPAADLERSVDRVLDAVAPTDAAQANGQRLAQQAQAAYRNRKLSFFDDARGSIVFNGSLPVIDGQEFMASVHAHLEAARRDAIGSKDRLAEPVTLEQRRADALMALMRAGTRTGTETTSALWTDDSRTDGSRTDGSRKDDSRTPGSRTDYSRTPDSRTPDSRTPDSRTPDSRTPGSMSGRTPRIGGDRPRVVVTIDQADLKRDLLHAGRLTDGQPISAGDLRRLACDAELLPIVLGGPSEILDVGRAARLVTGPIRAALARRDRGCSFPGCDTPAILTEAHHIRPWWAGGPTALNNLVLLCRHHHRLVEPDEHAIRDQWQVKIAADGVPEFIPPARHDPNRAPIRHHRHYRHQLANPPPACDTG